jgi:TonB-dependent starch-binding outer membrane protein SusC
MQKIKLFCRRMHLHLSIGTNWSHVMRLSSLLFMGVILMTNVMIASPGHGQNSEKHISLKLKSASLPTAIKTIEEKGAVVIMYENTPRLEDIKIDIDVKNRSITQILDILVQDKNLRWSFKDEMILLEDVLDTASIVGHLKYPGVLDILPPPIDIRGKIVNDKGEPAVGVSIAVKGSKRITATDVNGDFVLYNIDDKSILIITGANIETKEWSVNGRNEINITVTEKVSALDETVIIAYGTTTKRFNTGNVSTVKSEDIAKQPINNPLSALQGRVPGLSISQETGLPGGSFKVQLRGINSIQNGSDPLYIIDGIPVSAQTLGSINGNLRNGNPFNFLNAADIESIDVLKDADATAIYGSRGASGVILITTKKGRSGRTKLDADLSAGQGRVARKMDLMNTQQYLEMRREAFKNDNIEPTAMNAPDLKFWDTTRYTNWQEELFNRPAHYNNAQLTLSGGNTNTVFSVSGGVLKETTVLPGNGNDLKTSVHLNLANTSANKKFRINISTSYIYDKNTVQQQNLAGIAFGLPPNAPAPFNEDGSLNWAPITPGGVGSWGNPFASLLSVYKGSTNNLLSNIILSYNILSNLEIKASVGYNSLRTNEFTALPLTMFDPGLKFNSGSSNFNTNSNSSWIAEPQLNYKLKWGKGLLTALAGGSFQNISSERQGFTATSFTSDALLENIQAAGNIRVITSINNQYRYAAVFGRLNYSWNDKYLLNATVRRDGSGRFGPSRQWANFASIGAGWIFSEEYFFKNKIPVLSFGKLRGSYGSTGSDQVPDYAYMDLYSPNSYVYQAVKGLRNIKLLNPYLAWELTRKMEFGLELGFLKNKISLSASYYRNRSGNQLLSAPLSFVTGFPNITANLPAIVQNNGWEFLLNTTNINDKNFRWSTSFNISANRNKLLSFDNIKQTSYNSFLVVGQPIDIIQAYHRIEVDKEKGIDTYSDKDGKPIFNPTVLTGMRVNISRVPKFFGGLQNTFSYKSFQLDVLFQFVKQKGSSYLRNYAAVPGIMGNQPLDLINRWQKPGDIKSYQQFTQNPISDAYKNFSIFTQSDYAYTDASFIRLKNVSLSWTLPNMINNKIHLQSAMLYIRCQNLLTFTRYNGTDPEAQSVGVPPLRMLTAGVRIGL